MTRHRITESPVYHVGCPSCGAQPGTPCVSRTGRPAYFHIARTHVVFPPPAK